MLKTCLAIFAFVCAIQTLSGADASPWFVGAAKVDITPDYPVRLNGYGGRRTEVEGVEQRLFAKAIAFGRDTELPAVIVTVDNCGVPASIRDEVVRRLGARTKVTSERFAVCSSHTHSAPMLVGVGITDFGAALFGADVPPEHWERIQRYTRDLTDWLEQVAVAALADRQPATLAWGVGHVGFAHNRRAYAFRPEDHSLPVLRVTGADGKVRALLTSYACHCTTTGFNKFHADWAGCAQEYLEQEFPGAIALTAIGCGADQNPNPRGTYEHAIEYGRALGAEAKRLAGGEMKPLAGRLECRSRLIQLPFRAVPTRAEWETKLADKSRTVAYHAKMQLAKLDRGMTLATEMPYLVQVWNFGADLAMVFLAGEVVVDYAIRLKQELDAERLWVNSYANDVAAYIPSERVLQEGGYEGGGAMLYDDWPAAFAPGVEDRIVRTVHELIPAEFKRPQ
ncbi:MAG: hypothetical protein RIQ93_732 [Verrucomicrobiota bacterium]|jgi:hypothetical protein